MWLFFGFLWRSRWTRPLISDSFSLFHTADFGQHARFRQQAGLHNFLCSGPRDFAQHLLILTLSILLRRILIKHMMLVYVLLCFDLIDTFSSTVKNVSKSILSRRKTFVSPFSIGRMFNRLFVGPRYFVGQRRRGTIGKVRLQLQIQSTPIFAQKWQKRGIAPEKVPTPIVGDILEKNTVRSPAARSLDRSI